MKIKNNNIIIIPISIAIYLQNAWSRNQTIGIAKATTGKHISVTADDVMKSTYLTISILYIWSQQYQKIAHDLPHLSYFV